MFVMGLTPLETVAIWTVFGIALLGLAYAVFLRSQILREDKGTPKMQEVWNAIKDGADAYLGKQLRSILRHCAVGSLGSRLRVLRDGAVPVAWSRLSCLFVQE